MAIEQTTDPAAPDPPADGVAEQALVLNPHLTVVQCSEDELLVKHGTRSPYSEVLRDEGRTGVVGKLVRGFATPASLATLQRQGRLTDADLEAATELARHLVDRGVLVRPETELAHAYLGTVFGATPAQLERLAATVVGLVGCGPLGARIATALAPLHPKGLVLLDPRPVTRAHRADPGLGGKPPKDGGLDAALRARLRGALDAEVVPAAGLADEEALAAVCDRADVVVCAQEGFSPALLHTLNELAIERRTTWMSVYFDGSEAVVGPTYVIGETCCYLEFEAQAEASLRYRGEYLLYKELLKEQGVEPEALALPPYAMAAAGLAATSLLQLLVRGGGFTANRAVRLNFETLSLDFQDVFKLPRCPACSGARPTYRNLFL